MIKSAIKQLRSLKVTDAPRTATGGSEKIKIVSWNLLHTTGAVATDVADIVTSEQPDLLLMQEATSAIDELPSLIGGHCYHQPWIGRRHGLAVWTRDALETTFALKLPVSGIPGSLPQRVTQLIEISGLTIANVHLSHGQVLNRRQLQTISRSVEGPTAIIGDYNAVGKVNLKGFKDVGPRGATHRAQRVVPFRLDRCMVRDLNYEQAYLLDRGMSDHRPIAITLCSSGD